MLFIYFKHLAENAGGLYAHEYSVRGRGVAGLSGRSRRRRKKGVEFNCDVRPDSECLS